MNFTQNNNNAGDVVNQIQKTPEPPYESLKGLNENELVSDDKLKEAARELFKRLPMVRAFDCDYENALILLRRVYDMGRTRGLYEHPGSL